MADHTDQFMKQILNDLHALELILATDRVERGVRRIGAEQEMFLVDSAMMPACVNQEVLLRADDSRLTTELGRFNIEANATPRLFGGRCLREMESELDELLGMARVGANLCQADVVLIGILPTLREQHLGMENMTPNVRYREMNDALKRLRQGKDVRVTLKGLDEINIEHGNVMLEACNTSFQIHFQVAPEEFARLYNLAQAVSAPVLAAAVNSPLLMGRRLWKETRVALFQSSVDERVGARVKRGSQPRVHFGFDWVKKDVVELLRGDIARFRLLLSDESDEDAVQLVKDGGVPELSALRLHNSTIWRWNRPCYGVANGIAHLRIENRILPAGPTVLDEVSNAAFFFGLMAAMADDHSDIAQELEFDDAKNNFFAAAQHGLQAQFTWIGGEALSASQLILDRLLPLARKGLTNTGIDSTDISRYLDTVQARVEKNRTGSQWVLQSLANVRSLATSEIRDRTLTAGLIARQKLDIPVHQWTLVEPHESQDWRHSYRSIGQFMTTDVFTVQPTDIVDLAASLMEWEHIRQVPVEDDAGNFVGLVSHRDLLRLVARGKYGPSNETTLISDIMEPNPITVTAQTSTIDAIRIMREKDVGCLPVVKDNALIGIVTEHDLLAVSYQLLVRYLSEPIDESA